MGCLNSVKTRTRSPRKSNEKIVDAMASYHNYKKNYPLDYPLNDPRKDGCYKCLIDFIHTRESPSPPSPPTIQETKASPSSAALKYRGGRGGGDGGVPKM